MANPIIIGPASMRDESDAISASWWNGPNGTRVRYSMSVLWDAIDQACIYAVQAQAPSIAPYDALQWASADRRIVIGYQEGLPSFRARLIQWLDRAAYRGRSTGVALGVRGWILPQLPQINVINQTGNWWSYADGVDPMPAGAETVTPATVTAGTWNWDGNGSQFWARGWVVIYSTDTVWCTQDGTWGSGGTWGDGNGWGFNESYSVFAGLSSIVRDWKSEVMLYPLNGGIIVSFSDAWFQPTSGSGDLPDGTYGQWYKITNNNYVQSRTTNARYLTGAN
jgi:hypothetical protein